ncbi:sigma-54 interaction domain-containing protein [Tindallia californiensis]|uniref:Sigma-54 interaction domain-containing protein n=1 Tax=Tindallia californiensis TaxID=159292 RepID=A0A1H3R9I9_9FIRM|nr:sigma 54-interacting transcriptional regulator [Tindallia californiensis]SDZ21639.1 Sigma-54 interaction domain-containing protein [Tindallia californiensis]
MDHITILAHNQHTASFYKDILESIFSVEVLPLLCHKERKNQPIELSQHLLLTTTYTQEMPDEQPFPENLKTLRLQPCLSKSQCQILSQLPEKQILYFHHRNHELLCDHQLLLNDAGYPVYKLSASRLTKPTEDPKAYIITTDNLNPSEFDTNQLVLLGPPFISSFTMNRIATTLHQEDALLSDAFQNYLNRLTPSPYCISNLPKPAISQYYFTCVIESISESIILATKNGHIISMNKSAYQLLEIGDSCIQKNVLDILPIKKLPSLLEKNKEITKYRDHFLTIKSSPIASKDFNGFLFTLHSFVKKASNTPNQYHFEEKGHQAKYTFYDIKGISGDLLRCKDIANQMAKSSSSVLITGESGTGKELFAQAIHNASERSDQPFVVVNCASISPSLLESELFGYVEGAFTGAKVGGKKGLFLLAHQGTIFLDEIAELPLSMQSRLLRVLQEKEIRPVGSDHLISIDVRVIAATHQNLDRLVAENKFRLDLYYRLKVLPLHLPPLRHRKQDILILFQHMQQFLGTSYLLSEEAKKALIQGNWQGNLRELKNCAEYLAHLEKNYIDVHDLPPLELIDDRTPAPTPSPLSRSHCEVFVLKSIYQAMKAQKKIGRRSILSMAQKKELSVTEQDIRNALQNLYQTGDIIIGKGRQGTSLTEKGIETLQHASPSSPTGESGL